MREQVREFRPAIRTQNVPGPGLDSNLRRRKKITINLDLERAKLMGVEQRRYQASLWSACTMQHEAISHTLIHIREQCDASREMQEREARLAYERILSLENLLTASKLSTNAHPSADSHLSLKQTPADPNNEEHHSQSENQPKTHSDLPEFEQHVFDYLEANRCLANQRIRWPLFPLLCFHPVPSFLISSNSGRVATECLFYRRSNIQIPAFGAKWKTCT